MSKYVTITPSSGATSATANVTIYTSSISGYGTLSGKIYICNKNAAIKDIANNSLAQSTLTSANMYFDKTWAYSDGTIVYFNPTIGSKCTDYTSSQSNTGVKSGCMKWYAYNDSKSNTTINLLLDHNTSCGVSTTGKYGSYCPINNLDPMTNQLRIDTSSWTGVVTQPTTSGNSNLGNGRYPSYAINYNNSKAKLPPDLSSYSFAKVNASQAYWTYETIGCCTGCLLYVNSSESVSMSNYDSTSACIRPVIEISKSKL